MCKRTKIKMPPAPRSPRRAQAVAAAATLLAAAVACAAVVQKRGASSGSSAPRSSAHDRSDVDAPRGRRIDPVSSPGRLPEPALARVAEPETVAPTVVRDEAPPGPTPEGMAWIPPGRFAMGSDHGPFRDARPIHAVELDGFFMDRTAVTNEQFARFVRETG